MPERIHAIIATLNRVHVSGEDDMMRMLGCLQALKTLADDMKKSEEEKKEG